MIADQRTATTHPPTPPETASAAVTNVTMMWPWRFVASPGPRDGIGGHEMTPAAWPNSE